MEGKEIKEGRWTLKEHINFLKYIGKFRANWKKVSALIPTRTIIQIRTHANKFLNKLKILKMKHQGLI